jgi:GcrA cell cycle regulator
MSWTDERIDSLRTMWDKGMSASQIAEQLGGGITRNAVIGKAHRLGLKSRPSPVKADSPRKVPPPPTPTPTPIGVPRDPEAAFAMAKPISPRVPPTNPVLPNSPPSVPPTPTRRRGDNEKVVTLLDLTDKICKWPIGHPDEDGFHFCGAPVNAGTPYCLEHCALAYQSQLPRKDKPRPLPMPRYRV